MQTLKLNTNKKIEWIDVTAQIEQFVVDQDIEKGAVLVFVPHTTAGVTINENADPDVVKDINNHLNMLVPESEAFKHREGNSDGHIKASLMGSSVTIPVVDGKPSLGVWQSIYFCEFDGPRVRKYSLSMLGAQIKD